MHALDGDRHQRRHRLQPLTLGEQIDAYAFNRRHGDDAAHATRRASNLVRTADELRDAARRARAGTLE